MQPSEEIKSRLDIVDVIREYMQLKQAGGSWRGLCPFHNEKTPSFMVSPDKQIWHCFGCGKGGDIFAFVKEIEGIEFREALRLLAPKAGVELKKADPEISTKRNRLLDLLDLSKKYYHYVLTDTKVGVRARSYLEERKINEKTAKEWRVGFSPDSWNDLIKFLKQRGFAESEIFAAGMSIKKEGKNEYYNRFRGRIMFPINDLNGNVAAFSARVLPEKDDGKTGKYINSPQSEIYNKSEILFGLDKAKLAVKKHDLAVLVEGQMDVITAHQYGYKNVIAASGTALTSAQIRLIKRYTNNIALAFDMDKAGEMAVERGMKVALEAEMNIKVIELPQGKDPDECIKNDPGVWEKSVEDAKPMLEYFLDKLTAKFDLKKVENKRQVARAFLSVLADVKNKIEQDYWLKTLGQKLDVNEIYLREALAHALGNSRPAPRGQTANTAASAAVLAKHAEKKSREECLSELLLVFILKFPELAGYAADHVFLDEVFGQVNKNVYNKLLIYYNNISSDLIQSNYVLKEFYANFRSWLETEKNLVLLAYCDKLALIGDRDYDGTDSEAAKIELIKIMHNLRKSSLLARMKDIGRTVGELEKSGRTEEARHLLGEMRAISSEIKSIDN